MMDEPARPCGQWILTMRSPIPPIIILFSRRETYEKTVNFNIFNLISNMHKIASNLQALIIFLSKNLNFNKVMSKRII